MTANIDLTGVDSSYKKNSYGDFFYSVVKIYKPKRIVELGTYMGYSALHIAAGIRDCPDVTSYFTIIDLGNEYKFRHCSLETTRENFRKNDLLDLKNCKVEFLNEDAFECAAAFENDSIDLVHVDLSNDGKSLRKL